MKTPAEVAAALYPTLSLPASPTGADLRAVMAAAIEADRAQRGIVTLIAEVLDERGAERAAEQVRDTDPDDDLWNNYIGPMIDGIQYAYTISSGEIDDDYQGCSSCGDRVHTLSTDGLCDGCVAEREPVSMEADDLKPGHVFRHGFMRPDHRVRVERTYRYTPSRGILAGMPMLGVIYTEDHYTGTITGTMRIRRDATVWVDRDSMNEEGR